MSTSSTIWLAAGAQAPAPMASTKSVLKWESNRGGLLLRGRGAGVPAEAGENAGKSMGFEHIDVMRFEHLAGMANKDLCACDPQAWKTPSMIPPAHVLRFQHIDDMGHTSICDSSTWQAWPRKTTAHEIPRRGKPQPRSPQLMCCESSTSTSMLA